MAARTALWQKACKHLGIPLENRLILCLDGGGIRGIMTLQLLKELEAIAGIPCYALFDMVAGTSTGGIIAGLIAAGKRAVEIEELYEQLVKQVFTKRGVLANKFINPPEYTKKYYRSKLKEHLGNQTIAQVCGERKIDLMITAKDVAAGEETFFTYFHEGGTRANTYGDVLLRAAMEATMSAPTYFTPLERLVDGGVTSYNNPSLAAIIEAVQYGTVYTANNARKYTLDKLSVLSFGTGCRPQFVKPDEVTDPDGPDTYFWLQWLMSESGDDASDMQSYLFRSKLLPGLDYRRFQISLDKPAISKLEDTDISDIPDVHADRLHDLNDKELSGIALDDVSRFQLMQRIGGQLVRYIHDTAHQPQGPFTSGLVDTDGRDLLVSRLGDTVQILKNLGTPRWVDRFEE